MNVMKLVLPSVEYKTSFIEAVEEFRADTTYPLRERWYEKLDLSWVERDFEAFVGQVRGYARGERLPPGFVPQTDFWLIDEGEFIGRVSIRHRLTESLERIGGHIGYEIRPSKRGKGYGTAILKLALPHARELGLVRVLLTCDETNEASKKIIEKSGGILENTEENPATGVAKRRYWIELG